MRQSYLSEPLVMLATVVQWLILATLAGALVGTGCSAFLHVLFATAGHHYGAPLWLQMVALPVGGLANGLLLYYGKRLNRTGLKDSVIVAVNDQHGKLPWRTLWIKPIATLVTLGCGGSAGKEGPCSHLGASIASGLGEALHLNAELRRRLVACGVSAGFASVFGTPIAGAIYGVEMLAIGPHPPQLPVPGDHRRRDLLRGQPLLRHSLPAHRGVLRRRRKKGTEVINPT